MANEPVFPPVISDPYDKVKPIRDLPIGAEITGKGIFGRSDDTAKYLIARSRFLRPVLYVPNGPSFEWPGGVEGISINGQIGNARHKYIGDNADVVQVMHRDSRMIEMTGMFAGTSGATSVRKLMEVITAVSPTGYWMLVLPGNLNAVMREQQVNIETYAFDHPEDDRTDSWTYSISFIRVGIGKALKQEQYVAAVPTNPVYVYKPGKAANTPKGKNTRVFVIRSGARTLRAVAQIIYHNPNRWREIYNLNIGMFSAMDIPMHILPTKILPIGVALWY